MTYNSSQEFESYLPVYDTVPEKWEEGRQFLIEHLKKISNAVNNREISWLLDQELLSGKRFIPGTATPPQYRSVLRIVVDVSPLVAGLNVFPHNVVFDANLTSIDSWVEATNSTTFTAVTFAYPELQIVGPNININSPGAFDRAYFIWEYIQEL